MSTPNLPGPAPVPSIAPVSVPITQATSVGTLLTEVGTAISATKAAQAAVEKLAIILPPEYQTVNAELFARLTTLQGLLQAKS